MNKANININPFNLIKYNYTKPTKENHNYGYLLNRYRGVYSQNSFINDIDNYHRNFSHFNGVNPNSINIDVDLFDNTLYGINNLLLNDGKNFNKHFSQIKNQKDFDVKVESLIKLIFFFEEGYNIVYGHTSSDFWGLVESSNFMNRTFLMLYVYMCLLKHTDICSITQMGKNFSTIFLDKDNEYRECELIDLRDKLDNASKAIIEVASQPQYKQAILDYYTYYAEKENKTLEILLEDINGWYEKSLLEQILQLKNNEE